MVKKRKSLGPGFSEEVAKVTAKTGNFRKSGLFKKDESPDWTDVLLPNFRPDYSKAIQKSTWRLVFFSAVCLALFFIIFLRLFHLQIVRGDANKILADGNRIQVKIIHAPRGVIFDRNGKILAANSPASHSVSPRSE